LGDVRGDLVTEDSRHLAEPTINFASQILSGQHAKVLKRGRPQ
jgi:triphosphatase